MQTMIPTYYAKLAAKLATASYRDLQTAALEMKAPVRRNIKTDNLRAQLIAFVNRLQAESAALLPPAFAENIARIGQLPRDVLIRRATKAGINIQKRGLVETIRAALVNHFESEAKAELRGNKNDIYKLQFIATGRHAVNPRPQPKIKKVTIHVAPAEGRAPNGRFQKKTKKAAGPINIRDKTYNRLIKEPRPFYVQAQGIIENEDGTERMVQERTAKPIKTEKDVENYANMVVDNVVDYVYASAGGTSYLSDINFIMFNTMGAQSVGRVAKLQIENCVLNVIRHYIGNKVDAVYEKFPQFKPNGEELVYVDEEDIQKIAKHLRICIAAYTKIGLEFNTPWRQFGYANGKKINLIIENEHASRIARDLKVDKIVYDETTVHISELANRIDIADYRCEHDEKGCETCYLQYYTCIGDGVLTMHKRFRPSSVTGKAEDDENIIHAYITDTNQMLYWMFKQQHDLKPISDETLRTIAKSSEHFIGKKVIEELTNAGDYTMVDHNKNYLSYEKSPYYKGFPTNELVPTTLENSTCPAFYVINNIENFPKSFSKFFNYLGGAITLVHPVYQYLIEQGCIVDVKYVLDVDQFKHISISDFADNVENLDVASRKLFCNQLIGRTITGGVNEMSPIRCYYGNDKEYGQLLHECQANNITWGDNPGDRNPIIEFEQVPGEFEIDALGDEGPVMKQIVKPAKFDGFLTVNLKKKTKGLFNFHSYILGYAAIHMMDKWREMESNGFPVVGFNVDALVVKGKYHEHSTEVGKWKTEPLKPYFLQLTAERFVTPVDRQIVDVKIPARKPVRKDVLITGAAGISKSFPWVDTPAYNQVILTPTRFLRDEHKTKTDTKKGFENTHTAHKYFQFGLSTEKWLGLRAAGNIPQECRVVVIDEACMFTQEQWNIIFERRGKSIIVALTDFEQIQCEVEGSPVTMKYFQEHGFDHEHKIRTPELKCRHSYEFGQKLDHLRGKSYAEQVQILREQWADHIAESIEDFSGRVVVGDHQSATTYNNVASANLEQFPMKKICKSGSKQETVLATSAGVFWERKNMIQAAPKGTKYEPAYAVTADCIQGKTVDHIVYVDVASLARHGSLYTALTRTRTAENIKLLMKMPTNYPATAAQIIAERKAKK